MTPKVGESPVFAIVISFPAHLDTATIESIDFRASVRAYSQPACCPGAAADKKVRAPVAVSRCTLRKKAVEKLLAIGGALGTIWLIITGGSGQLLFLARGALRGRRKGRTRVEI